MALYEPTLQLYQEIGFPALQKGGQDRKLVGYFQSDTGTINQLIHLWKFDDDADRRAHWAGLSANKDFVEGFASKFRPLLMTQEVKLLQAAPWGPQKLRTSPLRPERGCPREGGRAMIRAIRSPAHFGLVPRA